MAFVAFDVLALDGTTVMGEPWAARRKRLEDLLEAPPPGVCLVPVTADAPARWDAWVGMGGEGLVLKERTAVYRPGLRSPAWLKLKPKLSLVVVVTGGSTERIRWGDWGEAVMLEFHYTAPADRQRRGDPPSGARAAPSALRSARRRARRAGVLQCHAERHPATPALGR